MGKIKPLYLVAAAVAAYILLKPKAAAAKPPSGMVTKPATPASVALAFVPAVTSAIAAWLQPTTQPYVDTSSNVVAPEGWL